MSDSRPTIGLALSGGAARGMAHVGAMRALVENKVPIDYIGGTSAGSIVGGAFAAGMPVEEIAEFGRSLRWRHWADDDVSAGRAEQRTARAIFASPPAGDAIRRPENTVGRRSYGPQNRHSSNFSRSG